MVGTPYQQPDTVNSLSSERFLRSSVFFGNGGLKTGRDLINDSSIVSNHIPTCAHIINDCSDRYFFTVLLLAAAIQQQICLLPANRAKGTLDSLVARYKNTLLVTDDVSKTDHAAAQITDLIVGDHLPSEISFPKIPLEQVIAIAFTSGSTGQPQAHPRSWGWAMQEARVAGIALGLNKRKPQPIVCTTPPQHMYGFVASIFIPLALCQPSYRNRPFFPEEIRETLESIGAASILVTTPTQIRACVLSNIELPQIDKILSSAASLDANLAQLAESKFHTKVVEFFGSTETGAIAFRRTTQETLWKTFSSITIDSYDNELIVSAPYLPGRVKLNDTVKIISKSQFELLGRSADLIKVGGKRASLADLNRVLLTIDGVNDGAFVVPESSGGKELRLAALVVAPNVKSEAIVQALHEVIDPVFLPRPVKIVDRLPRTTSGKLTHLSLVDLLKNQ